MSDQDNDDSSSIASAGAWDACVAHLALKHLIALVKGELGSREVDAPYVMVHGGLQGAWDKLRALERGVEGDRKILASKAENSQVGQILTKAMAAWNKAVSAKGLADQLVTMGGVGRIAELNEDLKALSGRIHLLEGTREMAFCLNLSQHVSSLSGGGSAASAGSVSLKEFLKFKAAHDNSLATIRQELKGGAIKIGEFDFNGEEACIAFVREHLT
jgi:hypothetical protein